MDESRTIAALATSPLPAGLAVIRVSGEKSKLVLRSLFRGKKDPVRFPRTLIFGEIVDYRSSESIDKALAVFMPGPWSYTGEDVAEFQFHGSPLLVQRILRSLFSFGLSPADPGEFTKRAFLNGKIDLAQAEAIADLIQAKSDEGLRLASEQLDGRFSRAVESIGEPLRNTLAEIEAHIDFPEEDIQPAALDKLRATLQSGIGVVDKLIVSYAFGQVVKEGVRVLLCGRPNAGKSSLLNHFLGKRRAIVSSVSGTTRDLIEEEAVISGFKFVFCDSAGIRDTDDEVERMGVELAKERIEWADIVLFIVDASDHDDRWKVVLEYLRGRAKKLWMVTNKVDLNPTAVAEFYCDSTVCQQNFYISVKSGAGLDALVHSLVEEVSRAAPDKSEGSEIVTNERHRECLIRSRERLLTAVQGFEEHRPLEVVSADIREGLQALDEIVGRTYTEEILGLIFSRFCIGK